MSTKLLALAILTLLAAPAVAPASVPVGDVSGEGRVSVADLVGELLALDPAFTPLPRHDADRDGAVDEGDVAFLRALLLARPPSFELPIHEDDGALLLATLPDGRRAEFFGVKDADGRGLVVEGLTLGSGDDLVTVLLDAQGRPVTLVLPDGTRLDAEWAGDARVRTLVTLPGGLQALSGGEWAPDGALGASLRETAAPASSSRATLHVSRCGRPASRAVTSLQVTPDGGLSSWIAGRAGAAPGDFEFDVPWQPSAAAVTAEQACKDVADLLGNACDALSILGPNAEAVVCPLLGVAATAAGTPAAGSAAVLGCLRAFGAARLACDTVGFSPSPAAPSLLRQSCAGIVATDRFLAGDVELVARARLRGQPVAVTSPVTAPAAGPFPALALDVTARCVEDACGDGADDDDDGLTDCDDPDCLRDLACAEADCDDGLDDDGDGAADCGDSDCAATTWCAETRCSDALDDDGDGAADCADSDCREDESCLDAPPSAELLGATCTARLTDRPSPHGPIPTHEAFVEAWGIASSAPSAASIQLTDLGFVPERPANGVPVAVECPSWTVPAFATSGCYRAPGDAHSTDWRASVVYTNGFGNFTFAGTSVVVAVKNGVTTLDTITVPCQ